MIPLLASSSIAAPCWNVGVALALILLAVLLHRRAMDWSPTERFLVVTLPAVCVLALALLLGRISVNVDFNWSSVRLAPAFSILYGETVYPGLREGAISGHIYGPVAALVYLPATHFETPVAALLAAGLITTACFFLPMPLLMLRGHGWARVRRRWLWATWGLLAFGCLVLQSDALSYNAFLIHAEGPALGFAMLACVLFIVDWPYRVPEGGPYKFPLWQFWLAALFASLAFWSKQTLAPLLVALPLFLWLRFGYRLASVYFWVQASMFTLVGLCFFEGFGLIELLVNEIMVPSRHPWLGSIKDTSQPWIEGPDRLAQMSVLLEAGFGLLRRCSKALFILIALAIWSHCSPKSDFHGASWRSKMEGWSQQPWFICVWVAFFLIPTSLLGRVKAGGDNNSYGPALCFFTIAAVTWLMFWVRQHGVEYLDRIARRHQFVWAVTVCLGVLAAWLLPDILTATRALAHHPLNQVVDYARARPGQVYFPGNPLITLMSEQKAYHFSYGIYDRELARMPVKPEHFQAGLPPDLQEVIYGPSDQPSLLAGRLTNFTQRVRLPELRGWTILRREPEPESGPVPPVQL